MHEGVVEIYREPEKDVHYVLGADIGQGVGATFSVAHILSVPDFGEPAEQCAKLRSNHIPAAQFGVLIFQLGMLYNRALVGVERNDQGGVTLQVLERGATEWPQTSAGYPNLYYQRIYDFRARKETTRLGWLTGGHNKDLMLGELQEAVLSDRLIIHSAATLVEMDGFSFDPDKNDWAQTHRNPVTKIAHTDEVMSLAIAWQMEKISKFGAKKPKDESW